MNHLLNITAKELRELLTVGTIISVVVVVVMFACIGQAMSDETDSATAPADIGIVYESGADGIVYKSSTATLTYAELVEAAYCATYNTEVGDHIKILDSGYGDADAITDEISEKDCRFAIGMPAELADNIGKKVTVLPSYFIYKDEGLFGTASNEMSTGIIANMSTILSAYIIADSDIGTEYVEAAMTPIASHSATLVNGTVYDDVTPYELYNAQMGQTLMIPIVVMLVIMMVGSVVISSMGSEKENKTLETLLTCPVKRTTIVSGKLLAAAIVGLFYGVCYLIGMMFYSNGLTSGITNTVNLEDYGLAMSASDWAIMFVILFLSIFAALGLCMILGAFTKNYKMAQTMVMPVAVLSMVPMFVFMFSSWSSLPGFFQAIMFAIPFSHPMMALSNLMIGNTALILGGIGYLVILDAVLIMLTVKIYNSDILITGLDKVSFMNRLGIKATKVKKR